MNYKKYYMTKKQITVMIMLWSGVLAGMSMLFYGRLLPALMLSPSVILFYRFAKDYLKRRQDRILRLQFKDFISVLADLLRACYSVENALGECRRELAMVYGEDSIIVNELNNMCKKIRLNTSPQALFSDLAQRTDIEEIYLFSQVFAVSKKTGGQLGEMIRLVADSINDSIVVEQEIEVAISEKKYELAIMCFVPMIIILYLMVSSPDLLQILYGTYMGNIVMTGCLITYAAAVYMGYRIVNNGVG